MSSPAQTRMRLSAVFFFVLLPEVAAGPRDLAVSVRQADDEVLQGLAGAQDGLEVEGVEVEPPPRAWKVDDLEAPQGAPERSGPLRGLLQLCRGRQDAVVAAPHGDLAHHRGIG